MIEALVALVILGICGTYFVQVALWHLEHGVRLRRRALALEYATNVLEEFRRRPWEDLPADLMTEQRVPDELRDRLPEGLVRVRIAPYEQGAVAARRITVEVRWDDRRAKPRVELLAFRSPRFR